MKFSINHLSKLIAPCVAIAIMAASNAAEASITVFFFEQDNNVIARTSGSLQTGAFSGVTNVQAQGLSLGGGSTGLLGINDTGGFGAGGLIQVNSGGRQILGNNGGLSVAPTSFSRDAFGFTQSPGEESLLFIANGGAQPFQVTNQQGFPQGIGALISPRTVFTFENTTLDDLGLSALVGPSVQPLTVYTDNLTGDTIVFVPEPSSMLMLALGAVGFTFRRRR